MSQCDLAKDPSLKRYFKFMLVNRRMSVQFTSKKIKDIIKNDLCINLDTPKYTKAFIEAFAFYMQSWPDWNEALNCTTYSDQLYQSLVNYLRDKLLYIKRNCIVASNKQLSGDELCIPADFEKFILSGVEEPYVLNIDIPERMWTKTDIQFKRSNKTDIVVNLIKIEPSYRCFTIREMFNHPNVLIEFKLPGLIHMSRSMNFKVERFIHSYDSTPFTQKNFDVQAEKAITVSKPKVYSYELLRLFFNSLVRLLRCKYQKSVSSGRRAEIELFCASILRDIRDANVCDMTVCEGFSVDYHINKASYSNNEFIDFDPEKLNEYVLYKSVFYPIGSYSLWSCALVPTDLLTVPFGISSNGTFNYFTCLENGDLNMEKSFLHAINSCITYKCLKCNSYFVFEMLQKHLNTVHPLKSPFMCNKCGKSVFVDALLQARWCHEGCK